MIAPERGSISVLPRATEPHWCKAGKISFQGKREKIRREAEKEKYSNYCPWTRLHLCFAPSYGATSLEENNYEASPSLISSNSIETQDWKQNKDSRKMTKKLTKSMFFVKNIVIFLPTTLQLVFFLELLNMIYDPDLYLIDSAWRIYVLLEEEMSGTYFFRQLLYRKKECI